LFANTQSGEFIRVPTVWPGVGSCP
jgi:hypothetical protein